MKTAEITINEKDKARFWAKVNKDGPLPDQSNPHYTGLEQCWIWTACKNSRGYGHIGMGGKTHSVHRIAWMLANGPIPHDGTSHGVCVLHRCDNPACCRVDHLVLGTNAENHRDKESKGRGNQPKGDKNGTRLCPESRPRGESHHKTKLTAAQVLEIRTLHAAGGASHSMLASQFGTGRSTIGHIILRKTWKI